MDDTRLQAWMRLLAGYRRPSKHAKGRHAPGPRYWQTQRRRKRSAKMARRRNRAG